MAAKLPKVSRSLTLPDANDETLKLKVEFTITAPPGTSVNDAIDDLRVEFHNILDKFGYKLKGGVISEV
jgi:hypothetical protein